MSHLILTSLISASLLVSVHAAPVLTSTQTSSSLPTSTSLAPTSAPSAPVASSTAGYILLDWDTATPTASSSSAPSSSVSGYTSSVLFHPAAAAPSLPSKTKASWALPPTFSNMDPFGITSYAAGEQNIAVLRGSPVKWYNSTSTPSDNTTAMGEPSHTEKWEMGQNALQIMYPNGSINPGNKPQGGAEFYGQPLDLRSATNTSLQYSVFFPHDFEFVKGGKLPGLYGGHKGCSGGNAAEDCFSTRIMWRAGGKGELYLYVPKDKQTPSLCSTPPKSICDSEYGLSIGRGAWTFALGDWTTIRQDIWLNTPGVNDGGFNIWINGKLVMTANDVRYRENALSCSDTISAAAIPENNEDWSSFDAENVDVVPSASTSATASSTSAFASSVSASVSSVSASASVSVSSSATSSRSPQPTFQTPLRRWMDKRDVDIDTESQDPTDNFGAAGLASALGGFARPSPVGALASLPSPSASLGEPLSDDSSEAPVDDTPLDSATAGAPDVLDGETDTGTDADALDASSSASPLPSMSTSPLKVQSASDDLPIGAEDAANCGVGFIGLFFSTFFGGHTSDWATPKDQYTYYKDFQMWVSE